ncbi:MAG: tetratricopeptide repeat protein [Lachnospiraceae bacterium]|nr:tetratricopeptide repeat protein [Lachnospiraceae bacterium]
MNNRYVLTLAAIEARLYTDEADSVFMRWPTAEKELPSGNHTPGGLSETCLHFMEDIMTKTGRPNHRWDNYLYLHFGGWDLLMDYVKRDPKRRGYLLRCEEKGYSVSGDRHYFDEALVSNGIVNGTAAAISSSTMKCIIEANIYLVRRFCGLYSSATMDTLCGEIRQFLETGSDEENGLAPQMDPQDRYYIFMYIRSCLEAYEAAQADGADADTLSRHLGTALAWLVLAALLRDSCENLCRLIPSPSIQLLRVQIREAQSSSAPAVAPASLPPVPGLFLGREKELDEIGRFFDSSAAPFFICGEGACGKTSLASIFASRSDRFTGIYAVYTGDLVSTIASIRFRDTLPMDRADVGALYNFNLNRLTQFSSQILLIIDNFDAPNYDRTFTELLSQGSTGMTNAEVLEDLKRAGVRLLFTTRTSVPPQYNSLCLSDAAHELPLGTLLQLAKSIYTDCPWTERDEVLMSQIILTVGKHVLLVELLSAALQQQSGFSSLEEMLDKLTSLQLPQIEGSVTTRRSASIENSVYELMRRIFRFSSYEEPVRQMLRQLSLLSPLGMDREPLRQLIGWENDKDFRDVLLRLRDLHLVSIDPRTAHISMHPVLAYVAAADLKPNADNCSEMIANAVRYFDEDSAQRYDARHLEQISAMCKRCVMVLIGQKSDTDLVGAEAIADAGATLGSEITPDSGVAPGSGDTLGSADTSVTVRLSLAISGIDYRLGSFESAAFWAEQAFTELGGWNSLESHTPESSNDRRALIKDRAEALKCAARAYAKLGEYDTACEYYEKELELLPEDMESELAVALNDYGVLLEEMGRFEESLDCLTKAWEIQQDLFGPDSPETISTCNNLGLISTDMGDNEAAEMFYRHALRIALEYYKEGHPETAIMYANLGELLMHSYENATGYEKESDSDSVEDGESVEADESAEADAFAGADASVEARLAESRHYLIRALEITTNAYGPDYPDNACTLSNLGILEDMEGNHKKAREHYRKALGIQSAAVGSNHPHCADILHNLGVSYIEEALEPFSSAEEFSAAPVDHKRDALPMLNKALTCEQKALSILESVFGKSHSSVEMLKNEVEWLENELYSS